MELSGSVRLRPTRIGFLVRPAQKSYSAIRQIMRLCSCLWGGTFNPIIPVATTLPSAWRRDAYGELTGGGLADAFIRFFEPEVFVEAEKGLAESAGIKIEPYRLHERVIALSEFVVTDDRYRPDFAFGLNIFDAYRDLYERQFQFVAKKARPFAVFPDKQVSDAYCDAVFGMFSQGKDLAYIRKGYVDAFEPQAKDAMHRDCLEVIENQVSCPFDLCNYELDEQSASRSEPTIYVFDPSRAVDLIDFWNVRQFRHDVLPVHVRWFPQFADLIRRCITSNYRPLPGNPHGVMIQTTVEFSRSISNEMAKELATKYIVDVPAGSWLAKLWYDPIWRNNWRGGGIQPRRAKLTAAEADVDLSLPKDELAATFQSLSPKFAPKYGPISNHVRWATTRNRSAASRSASVTRSSAGS